MSCGCSGSTPNSAPVSHVAAGNPNRGPISNYSFSDSEDSDSDEGEESTDLYDPTFDDKPYQAILIQPDVEPSEITLSLDDIRNVLNLKDEDMTDHISRDIGGYALILFVDDLGARKELPYNNMASFYAKDAIYGPAVLIEDYHKPLSVKDLSKYGFEDKYVR